MRLENVLGRKVFQADTIDRASSSVQLGVRKEKHKVRDSAPLEAGRGKQKAIGRLCQREERRRAPSIDDSWRRLV